MDIATTDVKSSETERSYLGEARARSLRDSEDIQSDSSQEDFYEAQQSQSQSQSQETNIDSREGIKEAGEMETKLPAKMDETTNRDEDQEDRSSSRGLEGLEDAADRLVKRMRAPRQLPRQFPDPSFPSYTLPISRRRKREPGVIYIDWDENDKQNPFHWRRRRKRKLLALGFFFATMTISNASSYTMGAELTNSEFGTSVLAYTSGSTTFLVAVAFAPMILAPISEVFGRRYVFIVSGAVFVLTYLPQAMAQNIFSIVITRFFQGCAASTGSSLVAGTIADLYHAAERGNFIMLFSLCVFFGQACGPLVCGFISTYASSWRWIWWTQGILGLVPFLLMVVLLEEPRGIVLLSRRARDLTNARKEIHRTASDDERASLPVMIRFSLSRPFKFLFCEVIVLSLSIWTGFTWATLSLFIGSIKMVFQEQYGYTNAQVGLVYLAIGVGGILGYVGNFQQERIYAKESEKCRGKPPAEARLYFGACLGAIIFPLSLFFFAWTARPSVSPAAPIVALVLLSTSIYWIHVSVISYIADCFERYTASGIAAEYFFRVLLSAFFPLFLEPMYRNLGPPIASSVLGAIAAILGVCPFILIKFGKALRKRSTIVKQLEQDEFDLMNRDLELN